VLWTHRRSKTPRKDGGIKIRGEVKEVIEDLLKWDPDAYLDEITEAVWIKTKCKLSESSVYRYLKRSGKSLRVLCASALQKSDLEGLAFQELIKGLRAKAHQFIFFDETSKSSKSYKRRRGWLRPGMQANIIERIFEDVQREC